jgi:redox-sensitive bicupin YhaK (pirin superfamily)
MTRVQQAITIRPRRTIFHAEGGWFSANWHFGFDHYYDPDNMGWGPLRVFNDDRLIAGAAWPMHPHRDIEGITYVAEGTFEHADSAGNNGVLPAGSIQRVTLGSGMMHSERNHSSSDPMRFIQMWILPARKGLPPSLEQRSFPEETRRNVWRPVLVPAPGYGAADAPTAGDAVHVHQDAAVYATLLDPARDLTHQLRAGFGAYLFLVHGEGTVGADGGGGPVDEGGAAKIAAVGEVSLQAGAQGAEALLVEVRL